jgi:hypothetical protein
VLSPRLVSSGSGAGGGVCPLKGGGRVFCPGCPSGGGRERGAGSSQNTCHLPWVTRYLLPMLSLHDQSRGPWILLHVVSGPWTLHLTRANAEKPYAGDTPMMLDCVTLGHPILRNVYHPAHVKTVCKGAASPSPPSLFTPPPPCIILLHYELVVMGFPM